MEYYVYTVTHENDIVYVGKGTGKRLEHVLSGKSHNYGLNDLYFKNKYLNTSLPLVSIVKYFESSTEALAYEKYLIYEHMPIFNVYCKPQQVCKEDNGDNLIEESLDFSRDTYVNPIPLDKDELLIYLQERYSEYLRQTLVQYPNSFKSFIKSKTKSSKWLVVKDIIHGIWESLPDMTRENGGHNKSDFAIKYSLSEKERECINNRKKIPHP